MYTNNHISIPSLCIPRVHQDITLNTIADTIKNLDVGTIDRIDVIPVKNNFGNHKRVFIHFKKWFSNERTTHIYNKLKQGDSIKVFYDDPWFWKISLNKSRRSY